MNEKPIDLVMSREEVRNCDRIAIERFEINGLVLMENAGSAAASLILSLLKDASSGVCIVAGVGNNAGDGFVVARHLYNAKIDVEVLLCPERDRFKGDALANLRIIEHMRIPIVALEGKSPEEVKELILSHGQRAEIVVDALLGTGTSGAPREPIRSAIEAINTLDKTVVALDIPSGLDCDTGEPLESAVRADHTITFAAMKKGFLNPAAAAYTGKVRVASIGIEAGFLR